MDVFLFGISIVVSTAIGDNLTTSCNDKIYSSSNDKTKGNKTWIIRQLFSLYNSPITISILLGLGLFSLSLIESAPSNWLILLNNDDIKKNDYSNHNNNNGKNESSISNNNNNNNNMMTVTFVYFLFLYAMCTFVLLIWPSKVGKILIEQMITILPKQECLTNTKKVFNNQHYCLYITTGIIYAVQIVVLLWRLCKYMLISFLYNLMQVIDCLHLYGRSQNRYKKSYRIGTSSSNTDTVSLPIFVKSSYSLPLCTASLVKTHKIHLIGSLIGIVISITSMNAVSQKVIIITGSNNDCNYLSVLVSWLVCVGITFSSILNGFGSVSLPYSCLVGLYIKPIKFSAIKIAEKQLRDTIILHNDCIDQYSDGTYCISSSSLSSSSKSSINIGTSRSTTGGISGRSNIYNYSPSSASTRQKILSSFTMNPIFNDVVNHKKNKKLEIRFLRSLIEDMVQDIEEMKYSYQLSINARRCFVGKLKSYVGVIFSILLLIKLLSALYGIYHNNHQKSYDIESENEQTFKKEKTITDDTNNSNAADDNNSNTNNGRDPITTCLLYLLGHHLVTEQDYDTISQFVSLILSALLSLSQIRNMLRYVVIITRWLKRSSKLFLKVQEQEHVSTYLQKFLVPPLHSTAITSTNIAYTNSNTLMSSNLLLPELERKAYVYNDDKSMNIINIVASKSDLASTTATTGGYGSSNSVGSALPTAYSYLLASLMGSYFVACIVLTKMILPRQYHYGFSAAIGGGDKDTFYRLQSFAVDSTFALSAILSCAIISILFGIRRTNSFRYDNNCHHNSTTTAAAIDSSSKRLIGVNTNMNNRMEEV